MELTIIFGLATLFELVFPSNETPPPTTYHVDYDIGMML